ncbi:SIR2 family protein [Hymenobacter arizonensis]|uniref:NAD(+) hydrolase ThsA n=1 Tax=Hymenobacter arizonensis TaxID=1227077 RepID=A0A1I6BG39_HYMAR|nr:SIR2 family protein [Hymenobacter arizonensis]SFQ79895.1 SIR2-like domain-containing protein [Hymenobacter arizonensis]
MPALTTPHQFTPEQNSFIHDYLKEVANGDAAVFAGAGLSVGAGYVDWRGLLEDIAQDVGLKIDQETDLISLAQFHHNERGGRGKLNARIIEEFTEKAELTQNHKILARLPINTFWTTNYDSLIETALEAAGKRVDTKHEVGQLSNPMYRRQAVVYKMHGDAKHADQATLTKDDYERYHSKNAAFVTTLSSDLVSKTFLFVGFSFTDPNLDYILSRVRLFLNGNSRPHFCLIKRVARHDKGIKSKADFDYKTRRQQLMVSDLKRFQITAVYVNDYTEIPLLLREIETRYKRKTVFISGSAAHFAPYPEQDSLQFIHDLSRGLVENKFSVINGFGVGVGSAVINGALEAVEKAPRLYSEDQLIMRPFPQVKTGRTELEKLWKGYRERMMSFAGIAIFIFGNKLQSTAEEPATPEIVLAGGVRKEFEIAKSLGLLLVPIGATGSMAKELWAEVQVAYDSLFPNSTPKQKRQFLSLGDETKTLDQHRETVIELIKKFNQNY